MRRYHNRHHKKHPHHHRFKPVNNRLNIKNKFYKTNNFVRKHPIMSAVFSIILSIILIRISFLDVLFSRNITELRLWFLFFAIVLGIIGLISLKVWFRNNVSDFNTQHKVEWKKR